MDLAGLVREYQGLYEYCIKKQEKGILVWGEPMLYIFQDIRRSWAVFLKNLLFQQLKGHCLTQISKSGVMVAPPGDIIFSMIIPLQ